MLPTGQSLGHNCSGLYQLATDTAALRHRLDGEVM